MHGLLLVLHRLERAHAIDTRLRGGQRHLPKLGFKEQAGTVEVPGTAIANQKRGARVDGDDVIEQR